MPANPLNCRLIGPGLLAAVLAGGCASTTPAPMEPELVEEAVSPAEFPEPEFIPIIRYGRYTLVELAPAAAQRDLLLQTIDVAMPERARATVGDGLRHVLKRSGYQLCDSATVAADLYALPLPAVHLHLGPMSLRDALLTLAGPAWELREDDLARRVCFERAGADVVTPASASQPLDGAAVQTFPIGGDQP